MTNSTHHGVATGRGCSHAALGSFCKLLPALEPAFFTDEALKALGAANGIMHDKSNGGGNSNIPAAYTFFAQFVDHDITLDVSSQLNSAKIQDPLKVPNLRSMTLDLDCIYGFGPEASPYLYEDEKLVVGNPKNERDLRRVITTDSSGEIDSVGRALIGDPRNDENLFISQLQYAFHLFHNKLFDRCHDFEEAQRQARFHYQYVVLNDFLRRVCDDKIYEFSYKRLFKCDEPLIYELDRAGKLQMPVEFSVAAYRFGHTMVRNKFQPNSKKTNVELFSNELSNGFSFVKPELTVEWEHLFSTGSLCKSKLIDEQLANELIVLPDEVVGSGADDLERSLAFRNLVRGRSLGLPDGRAVAHAIADAGYPLDPDIDLKLNNVKGWSKVPAGVKSELKESIPLFFYLLRESSVCNNGEKLGPTASAILMEVFGGILLHCNSSFLNSDWSPSDSIAGFNSDLTLEDILKFVGVYDKKSGSNYRGKKKKSTKKGS